MEDSGEEQVGMGRLIRGLQEIKKKELSLEDVIKSQKELEKTLITKVYQSKQETVCI